LEKKEDPKTEQLHGSKSETSLNCNKKNYIQIQLTKPKHNYENCWQQKNHQQLQPSTPLAKLPQIDPNKKVDNYYKTTEKAPSSLTKSTTSRTMKY